MTLKRFEEFVQHHAAWFRGFNPEPLRNLVRAEQHLGVTLPASLKWLLSHYGYWRATGVGGLPFVVATTLGCRPAFPASWVVLSRPACASFRGEPSRGSLPPASGYVVLITSAGKAADGKAVIVCDAEGTILRRYSGYSSYVMALQESLASCTDPNYQACQPAFHRNTSGVLCLSDDMFDLEEFRRRLVETITFFRLVSPPLVATSPPIRVPHGRGERPEAGEETDRPAKYSDTGGERDAGTGDMSAGNSTRGASLLESVVRERRDFLHVHALEIPSQYFHTDSSSHRSFVLPERIETGRLLLTPVEDAESRETVTDVLADCGVPAAQHVSLIRLPTLRGERDWLLTWVAPEQERNVSLGWWERARSAPNWILSTGEPLSELWPRLRRMSRAG